MGGRSNRMLAAAWSLAVLTALSACGASDGLRVETEQPTDQPTESAAGGSVGSSEEIFTGEDIRRQFLADDSLADIPGYDSIHDVLKNCAGCMTTSGVLTAGGFDFQLATVAPEGEATNIAGLAVKDVGGAPQVSLLITGTNLTLTPGHNGTIVAQEAVDSSASGTDGWSVQVYRYREGKFIAGQRVSGSQ